MRTPEDAVLDDLSAALDYDPETGELRWLRSTKRVTEGSLAGSIHRDGSLVIGFRGKVYQAHHLAWFFHTGQWPTSPILFRDKDPLNLRAVNLKPLPYKRGSKAVYMRRYRENRKARRRAAIPKSDMANVRCGADRKTWTVYAHWDSRIALSSFLSKAEAEQYAAMTRIGRDFAYNNPPELFPADPERNNLRAGGSGTLTYEQAATRFAYDPFLGAIYRRRSNHVKTDLEGTPAIEIDDTRRPIVRASGRTYSAGMLAWFLHTGGEWPKRKQLGYRDGNRRNTAWANLYLKGTNDASNAD